MTYWELSKSLDNMADKTGRSAMTAVVMRVLSETWVVAFNPPPDDGFNPRIHTRCCKEKAHMCYNRSTRAT